MDYNNFEFDFNKIISSILTFRSKEDVQLYLIELKRDIDETAVNESIKNKDRQFEIQELRNERLKALEYITHFNKSISNLKHYDSDSEIISSFDNYNLDLDKIDKKYEGIIEENEKLIYINYLYMYYMIYTKCPEINLIEKEERFDDKLVLDYINAKLRYLRDRKKLLNDTEAKDDNKLSDVEIETEEENDTKLTEKIITRLDSQVLIMKYMLSELKYNLDVPKTDLARFISFATGKNYKNVYDYVLKVFQFTDTENKIYPPSKFLKEVQDYFKKIGLDQLAKVVDDDRKLSLMEEENKINNDYKAMKGLNKFKPRT